MFLMIHLSPDSCEVASLTRFSSPRGISHCLIAADWDGVGEGGVLDRKLELRTLELAVDILYESGWK